MVNQELNKMIKPQTTIEGVIEPFGEEARALRQILRTFEDTLDDRGFDQLYLGMLTHENVFLQNLDFLGDRFMENLVYANVDGENGVVILPEGTMKTYDYMRRMNLSQAKIFYNEQFVRNEPVDEVRNGKTRVFYQTGFEIFNHSFVEASVDAMTTVYQMISNVGISDVYIRMSDKRLMNGVLEEFESQEKDIIKQLMDRADDDPDRLVHLYFENGGTDHSSIEYLADFLRLSQKPDLTLDDPEQYNRNNVFNEGLEYLRELEQGLIQAGVQYQILPFMAKSWDACDMLLFDARSPRFNGALAGGGNLTYGAYEPHLPKTGAGIGTTRLYQLLREERLA